MVLVAPKININNGITISKFQKKYIKLAEMKSSISFCKFCEPQNKISGRERLKMDRSCKMMPGLNSDAKKKILTDMNLLPFSHNSPKTVQYGDTSIYSIHTNHPSWSPGACKNLEKYEGRFIRRESRNAKEV